jgi:hypothetical protein
VVVRVVQVVQVVVRVVRVRVVEQSVHVVAIQSTMVDREV